MKPGDIPQFNQAVNEAQGDKEGIIYCAVYDPIKGKGYTAIYENLDIPNKGQSKTFHLLYKTIHPQRSFRKLNLLKTFTMMYSVLWGFPGGSVVKNTPANAGDAVSIPGSRRSPGEGNGNPLQYSYLGNPIHRGTWWTTVHEVTKELGMTLWGCRIV